MTRFPRTPELLAVAERVVWFQTPVAALADPVHFLAHLMTYGTVEDLRSVGDVANADDFRAVLDQAPAGFFDKRSWAYWNVRLGREWDRPLPVRRY
jgi:hypothetical protein